MVILCVAAGSAVVVLAVVGLVLGDFPVPVRSAIAAALWDRGSEFDFVIHSLRLPRLAVAVLAGMCLAASGALFQALIDNPLVSPDVIGIDTGAAAAAVTILAAGFAPRWLPLAAFGGALAAAGLILALAWRRGTSGARVVLVGIGINALLSAVITFMLVRFPIERVSAAARWQAGTLSSSSWGDARTLAVGAAVLVPLAYVLVRRLRAMQLGDDAAVGLGVPLERSRVAVVATGCGLAAVVVAVVGPLGFVALLVPHIARALAGSLGIGVMTLTVLLGAVMLLSADIAAQRLFAPTVLPAGVMTAALGGPYLLWVLRRFHRAG
ncbi:FecCD family ABC transporter permease [Candidatus Poriferisodalis sp.]|uniref:FecCD family ABC transporter permease n=1 Tax=Candidatus Poriferisodalis sp. TaxID=3101277 RepID=UPI003B0147AB